MPPLKKKKYSSISKGNKEINKNDASQMKRKKWSSSKQNSYEVSEILSCRINPNSVNVELQFLVSWQNYGPESNSWEPLETLRLNTVFINYINTKFREFEADIYVNVCNIKEKLKFKRRKTLDQELKVAIMLNRVFPFDPFEYKCHQVVYHLMSDDPPKRFTTHLEDLVFRSFFFKLDEIQRIKHDKLAKDMSEKEEIVVTIENDVDFECPPEFNYITKNICSDELLLANETLNFTFSNTMEPDSTSGNFEEKYEGCDCGVDKCSKESNCCPKLIDHPFAYKEVKNQKNLRIVRLNRQEALIECSDKCSCDENCLNRVTQQKRSLQLCLFKTENRGWGVKTMAQIKKGVFILEYTGEIVGNVEAGKRETFEFLFDLNMDRKSHGYYTIDAFKHGNLARFVNHSCDANCSIWIISDCTKNPRNQKLCIFALRNLEKDEEITIDYSPLDNVPTTDRMNYSRSFVVDCNCGSENCKGVIY